MRARAAALLLVLLSSACGTGLLGPPPGTQPVLGYTDVDGRPAAVSIRFSGCEPAPDTRVEESDDAVRITIADGGGCEPLHHAVLTLEQPLADRTVIDGSTGQPVPRADDGDR